MAYETILYQKKESVASIMLNSPDKGNVITVRAGYELADVCAQINADDEVRTVIFTGAGEHFCIGADPARRKSPIPSLTAALLNIKCPVIAAINGDALDEGLELVLACDLRVAASTARFGFARIATGHIPYDGGTQLLPRIVGRTKAMEMILLGEVISATYAAQIGLVNRVVPQEELMPVAAEIAATICSKAPLSLRYAKEAVCQGLDLTLEQGMHLEADLYHLLQTTEDRTEGITAFRERRVPRFKGR
jgi:enoyl-CoA hydratase/carnithine racemase